MAVPRRVSPQKAYVTQRAPAAVGDFHDAPTRRSLIEHHRVVQDVGDGRRDFALKQENLSKLREQFTDASVILHRLTQEQEALQNALQDADTDQSITTAERMAKIGAIRANLHTSQRAIELQAAHAKSLDQQVIGAEHELLQLEVALGRKVERLDEAKSAEERRQDQQRSVAVSRVGAEGRNSERLADRVLSSTVGHLQEELTTVRRGAEAHDAARTAHAQGAATLRTSKPERDEVRGAAARLEQEAIDRRIGGILSLKQNLETVSGQLHEQAHRKAERRAAKHAAQAEEYQELLAAKQNPYEVWRSRERDAFVERTTHERSKALATERLRVAGEVIADDMRRLPLERKAVRDAEEEDRIRRLKLPVRKHAMETAYIMSKTIGNQQSLDPTGRAIRVEPSSVTAFRTPGFGLGHTAHSRPDIVAAMASKRGNDGVAPLKQWLPRELQDGPVATEEDLLDGDMDGEYGVGGEGYYEEEGEGGGYGEGEDGGQGADGGIEGAEVLSGGLEGADGRSSPLGRTGIDPLAPKPKKYPQRQLSVYEQRLMAAAKERQRANIVRKQVAAGKEFKGAGFACSPGVLHFKDFQVGVPYPVQANLTNASFTFNSFKLLPLPDAIRDLFDISIVPPGRMSAGTSVPFTITFLPRRNEDISTTLDVLAQTGLVKIPLMCTAKVALPLVKAPALDVGQVTAGEVKNSHFVVENEGALPLTVRVIRLSLAQGAVGVEGEEEMAPLAAGEEEDSPWSLPHGTTFQLPGYGSVSLPVRFSPMTPGPAVMPLRLVFDRPECSPMELLARGTGAPVPLYVEEDVLDLRTCLHGKLYRSMLTVRNRGTVALRCSPKFPPGLGSPELEIVPMTGYVQAMDAKTGEPGKFTFQVKFRPSAAMLSRPDVVAMLRSGAAIGDRASGSADRESKESKEDGGAVSRSLAHDSQLDPVALSLAPVLTVPLAIVAPDQVLPVPFSMRARVTPVDLRFEPEQLDFGVCPVGQAVSRALTVINTSALPQKFGFLRLPPGFHVSPAQGDGFGMLLPGETMELEAVFAPTLAVGYDAQLACYTTTVARYTVGVRGQGITPVLALSHPCVFMAAASVGETETAFLHMTNTANTAVEYHMVAPADATLPVKVSPTLGTLRAGQTVRLQVQYAPTEAYYTSSAAARVGQETALHKAAMQLGVGQEGAQGTPRGHGDLLLQEAAPAAIHETFQLPIYWREAGRAIGDVSGMADGGSARAGKGQDALGRLPPLLQSTVILQIATTAVPRILSVDKRTILFGQAPVGKGTEHTVRVTNHSELELELVTGALNPSGGFAIVNAPRVLPAHSYHDVIVMFKPTSHRLFTDRLSLGSKGHGPLAEVVLTGEGVSPTVVIDPHDAGHVDFGAVVEGDTVVRHLQLKNTSVFPLSFVLREESEGGTAGASASLASTAASPVPIFAADPMRGSIPAGGIVRVSVTYCPRHAPPGGLPHRTRFLVDVPNQDPGAAHRLYLSGRCFDRTAYALPALPSEELAAESASSIDTHLVTAPMPAANRRSSASSASGSPSSELYTLTFPREGGTPGGSRGSRGGFGGLFGGRASSRERPTAVGTAASMGSTITTSGGPSAVGAPAVNVPKELVVSCINRAEYSNAGGSGAGGAPPASAASTKDKGGAAAAASAPGTATYEVKLPSSMTTRTGGSKPHFFTVEGATGTVVPGSKAVVKFKFTPPTAAAAGSTGATPLSAAAPGGASSGTGAVLTAGEWHEVDATMTITGGFVAPGAPPTKTISVRLRGFVPGK